jgi:hypothetical protein
LALDTYSQVWNKVLLRCPSLSPKLAQDFVVNAFRRLAEIRRWSWLTKFGQFILPTLVTAGTVTVTQNSTTVIGIGTAWDTSLVGSQFRIGLVAPIYTVLSVTSATQLDLDSPWGGISASAQPYSIYLCFFTVPTDFHQFICLWDPAFNWQLFLDVQQSELNIWDAQRANISNAYVVSFRDYSTSQVGVVANPLQILGSGPSPSSAGTYTGPVNAVFTVQVTLGGAAGTATYQWKKNNGAFTTGVLTDAGGAAQSLQDGVQIVFPLTSVYILNDTFVISTAAISNAGLPRYELWPHQQAQHVYPFLYESRPVDLNDPNAVIPRYIPGDILMEMALEDVCLWPGASQDKPNPYYNLAQARYHHTRLSNDRADGFIDTLERQDDEVWQQTLTYMYPQIAWAMATPLADSAFLQSHSV